ncbi:hypothetical protein P3G55_03415 [Leptospira sp. 96542]|nr:hypothetical protein [Leptospira sp. 96542]
MFGFYLFIFQIFISTIQYGFVWPNTLHGPSQFFFWWTAIFSSIWIILFFIFGLGFIGIFLKVPILGIILQGFNDRIKRHGFFQFLIQYILVWVFSSGSLLVGTYLIGYSKLSHEWIPYLGLFLILEAMFVKQIINKNRGQKSQFQFHILQPQNLEKNIPEEKDITPK